MGFSGSPAKRGSQPHLSWVKRFLTFLRADSLRKTLVIAIIIVSLVPVVLVATISFYRTRSQIQSLVANQLFQITQSSSRQVEEFAQVRKDALARLPVSPAFAPPLQALLDSSISPAQLTAAVQDLRTQLSTVAQTASNNEPVFTQLFMIDQTGKVILSINDQFITETFGSEPITNPAIQPLINKTSFSLVPDPFPPARDGVVLLTSYTFNLPDHGSYTLIGTTSTAQYSRVLTQASAFLPGARAFFVDQNSNVITSVQNNPMVVLSPNKSFLLAVSPVISGAQTLQPITFSSFGNEIVLAYIQSIPRQGLSMVLQVPTQMIFGQIPLLDGSSIYMLVFALIILAGFTFIGASQVVNPLLHLRDVARSYTEGKFEKRVKVTRKDEIGQLAQSMNRMAEELSSVYSNLEAQVEQRTSQLRAASEVARLATTSPHLEEIIDKTVNLVNERFGLYSTSIYLTDETRQFLVLRGLSASLGQELIRQRLPVNSNSLPGWVAESNQALDIPEVETDPRYQHDINLPDTRSIAIVPIAVGSEVLGVLEVRSNTPRGIDSDLLFVLQTVANQIAGAIQNIRLLETAQVDLQETSLLYQVTRQVTGAGSQQEALNRVIESLPLISHTTALLDVDGDNLHIVALYDPRSRKLEKGLSSIDIPVRRMIEPLTQGNPIFLNDISLPSEFDSILSFFLRRGCRSAAILPCMQTGKPVNIMVIGFQEDQVVTQASLQPFINLSEVIGANLDKFNLLRTLQERLSELQVLATFSRVASAETSLNQLYHTLHELVTDTMGEGLGFILALYKADREMIEFPYAYENNQLLALDPLPIGNGLTSYVLQSRKPLLLVKDTEHKAVELGARIIGSPAHSWLGVPLLAAGQLIGALIIQDQEKEERFSQDDLNLMMTLAPQIATAVRNAQLLEEMQGALKAYDLERLTLNTWMGNTPDFIVVKDIHGTYLRASKSLADHYNSRVEALVGKSDFDLLPQEIASQIYSEDRAVIESGQPHLGDIEENDLGGEKEWYLVSRIPVRDLEGNVSGVMAIRRNITETKQAELIARERAEEIRTTSEIARDAAGILDLDELLDKSVNLIRDRFGFYHASVFLLDPLGEYAVLRESTGDAGRQMKSAHHRLAVGSRSIVGQSTARAEPVIVPDVTRDPTHFPNPLLPETRAEMAVPLIFAGKVIGALDVQSTQPNIFKPEDIEILRILADQLAATIHNAELFAAAQEMLGQHKLLHQINVAATTSNSLEESLNKVVNGLHIAQVADHINIFMLNKNQELELAAAAGYENREAPQLRIPMGQGIIGAAAQEHRPVRVDNVLTDPRYIKSDTDTRSEMALPIVFGDEFIGVLNLESNIPAAFDENNLDIMAALANNLGAVIANWRLVGQIRRQVDRQMMLYEATSKIRRSVDISTILETSVAEIGRTLGARRVKISLTAPQPANNLMELPADNEIGDKIGSNGHNGTKEK
jgi:PAS domain S-box-containing protein